MENIHRAFFVAESQMSIVNSMASTYFY